jgi:hypothetical protein
MVLFCENRERIIVKLAPEKGANFGRPLSQLFSVVMDRNVS